ncbi:MAG: amidohydrolase family protein [Puniceicoccaceae bacterium]
MNIWDIDFHVGLTFENGRAWVAEDKVVDLLDRYGIERAVISASGLGPDGWVDANLRISKLVASANDRLIGGYTSPTNAFRESETLKEYAEELVANGISCIRLMPETGPQAAPMVLGKDCAILEAIEVYAMHRVPLILPVGHFFTGKKRFEYGPDAIERIAKQFPEMPIILVQGNYRLMQVLEGMLKRCSNLYLTISGLGLFYQLESLVRRIGAERFVFGSGAPEMEPSMGIGMLLWSRLSVEEKQKIASSNVAGILGKSKC